MTQPELGKHIAQLRAAQGLTQQGLAERCKLNIRTIQRIEAGDVAPRMYTLNLLTNPLKMNLNPLNQETVEAKTLSSKMKVSLIAGLIYSINGIPLIYELITHNLNYYLAATITLIHIISCIFFFGGFFAIGKFYRNRILFVSSLIMMILLPAINMLDLLKNTWFSAGEFLIFIIMCVNMMVLGAGLLKESFERMGYENATLYKLAGILTIVISVLYLSLNTRIINMGLVLSVGGNILLVYILYRELASSKKHRHTASGLSS